MKKNQDALKTYISTDSGYKNNLFRVSTRHSNIFTRPIRVRKHKVQFFFLDKP